MTKEQEKEVRQYLAMKGISSDCIDGAVRSIRFHDATKALRDDKDVKRGRDIMEFKPNPGKATLTQVGETQTYLGRDNHGLPIYQEDVDMIKKALPLAKRLIELQKARPQEPEPVDTLRTLRDTIDEAYEVKPEELNMGPDTTENIHEIGDNYPGAGDWKEWRKEHADVLGRMSEEDRMNLEAGWYKVPDRVKESMLRSQGIKKNENMTHDDENKKTFEPREQYEKFVQEWDEIEKYHAMPRVLQPSEIIIDDRMYPSKEEVEKRMEECNKNVSDEDLPFPGDVTKYSYSNILRRMDDTHTRKNNDYGDAAYQGYKKFGPAYFLVQLHNKLSRLESLTIGNKSQQVKDESIDDTLLDMANYAVMYLESRHRND